MIVNSTASRRPPRSPTAGGEYGDAVRVLLRFVVPTEEGAEFRDRLQEVADLLATKAGHLGGDIGRNLDDPTLWLYTSRWSDVGSYRRALNAYDVKMQAHVLLARAIDEPSAFEDASGDLNRASARGAGGEPPR